MRQELAARSNPAEASLEAVLPGFHNQLAALQNSVNGTRTSVMYKMSRMCTEFMTHIEDLKENTRLELASQFTKVATSLLRKSVTASDTSVDVVTVDRKRTTSILGGDVDFEKAKGYLLSRGNPVSLTRPYYEYYGMEYYSGGLIDGGVAAAEAKFKNCWWSDYKPGESTHFNRVTRIIKAVDMMVKEGGNLEKVLDILDGVFKSEQFSISRMVVALKSQGVISSRRSPTAAS
jgi:hypothetical protein